jgi:hypothetical protein
VRGSVHASFRHSWQPEPFSGSLRTAAAFGCREPRERPRHLQRSEIREVREEFTGDQVGSSTMPRKRIPEQRALKELWKAISPRMTFTLTDIGAAPTHELRLLPFIAEFIRFCARSIGRRSLSRLFGTRKEWSAICMDRRFALAEARTSSSPLWYRTARKSKLTSWRGEGISGRRMKTSASWRRTRRDFIGVGMNDLFLDQLVSADSPVGSDIHSEDTMPHLGNGNPQ